MKKQLPSGPSPDERIISETVETALAGAEVLERLSNADPETEPERVKEMAEAVRLLAAAVTAFTSASPLRRPPSA